MSKNNSLEMEANAVRAIITQTYSEVNMPYEETKIIKKRRFNPYRLVYVEQTKLLNPRKAMQHQFKKLDDILKGLQEDGKLGLINDGMSIDLSDEAYLTLEGRFYKEYHDSKIHPKSHTPEVREKNFQNFLSVIGNQDEPSSFDFSKIDELYKPINNDSFIENIIDYNESTAGRKLVNIVNILEDGIRRPKDKSLTNLDILSYYQDQLNLSKLKNSVKGTDNPSLVLIEFYLLEQELISKPVMLQYAIKHGKVDKVNLFSKYTHDLLTP